MCECGCGQTTSLAWQNDTKRGWVKGEPLRFVRGHVARTKQRPPLGQDDYAVEDRGHTSACWIRRGRLNNKGYGVVVLAGKRMYAHRAMYEQEIGPIPQGLSLDHLCRQTACMNPAHLEPVTHAVNLRRGKGTRLTDADVLEIRAAPASIQTKDLASQYGISESHMSRIRRGIKYRL